MEILFYIVIDIKLEVYMGEAAMKESELEAVGVYVKKHIAEWIKESNIIPFSAGRISPEYEISLSERIIRVEEGLKHQGELLEKLIHQIDKRFEHSVKRFKSMNKRFESMSKRFDQIDKRFEQVEKRFEQIDKRFEQVDKRFEQVDKRFEQVDKRFEEIRFDMNKRFNQMFAYFTTAFVIFGIFIAVYPFYR